MVERGGLENRLRLWCTGVRIPPSPLSLSIENYQLTIKSGEMPELVERARLEIV